MKTSRQKKVLDPLGPEMRKTMSASAWKLQKEIFAHPVCRRAYIKHEKHRLRIENMLERAWNSFWKAQISYMTSDDAMLDSVPWMLTINGSTVWADQDLDSLRAFLKDKREALKKIKW